MRPGPIGLPQLTRAAGTIFSGRVTSVARIPASHGDAVASIKITFHVEHALRGARAGENLTIRQWMGLWSGGQRYRPGERILLFLYPRSKLGLTSCVAGPLGRFRVDSLGHVLLSEEQVLAFRADPVLGEKSRVSFSDFARSVQRASGEE
jgi:hypothetical protein